MTNLLVWNIEWATFGSRRGRVIQGIIADLSPDLICMTEGVARMLPEHGHVIESEPDYGYERTGDRRKVLLWGREPWTDVDRVGDPEMPRGRFVVGVTAGLRVVGVCVPWRDAHVRTGRRNREPWQDHLSYLAGLGRVLEAASEPTLVVGDFNQRVPRSRQPARVYDALMAALGPSRRIVSQSVVDDEDNPLVDHVAVGPGLRGAVTGTIPRHTSDGVRLSDHAAVLVEILGLDLGR